MDEDELVAFTPSYKLRSIDFAIAALSAFGGFLDGVTELLCAHANWQRDKARFVDDVRVEIERIVND